MADVTYEYVGDVNPNLICAICHNPFINPVTISSCKHTFCKTCILESLAHKKTCPIDRSQIDPSTLHDAGPVVLNMLEELEVKCLGEECGYVSQRGLMISHTNVCAKTVVKCLHKACAEEMKRDELPNHRAYECEERKMRCGTCDTLIPYRLNLTHSHNTIARPCGCLKTPQNGDHRWSCASAEVPCDHAEMGCPALSKRSDLEDHLAQCFFEQIAPCMNNMREEIDALKKDGDDKTKQINSLLRTQEAAERRAWNDMARGERATDPDLAALRMRIETSRLRLAAEQADMRQEGAARALATANPAARPMVTPPRPRIMPRNVVTPEPSSQSRRSVVPPAPRTSRRTAAAMITGYGSIDIDRPPMSVASRSHALPSRPATNGSTPSTRIRVRPDPRTSDTDLTDPSPFRRRLPSPRPRVRRDPSDPRWSGSNIGSSSIASSLMTSIRSEARLSGAAPTFASSSNETSNRVIPAMGELIDLTMSDSSDSGTHLDTSTSSSSIVPEDSISNFRLLTSVANRVETGQEPHLDESTGSSAARTLYFDAELPTPPASEDSGGTFDEEPRSVGNGTTAATLGTSISSRFSEDFDAMMDQMSADIDAAFDVEVDNIETPAELEGTDIEDPAGSPHTAMLEIMHQLEAVLPVITSLGGRIERMERVQQAQALSGDLRLQEEIAELRGMVDVMRPHVMGGGQSLPPTPRIPSFISSSETMSESTTQVEASEEAEHVSIIRETVAFSSRNNDLDDSSSVSSLITANNPIRRNRWGNGTGRPMGIPPELGDGTPTRRVVVHRPVEHLVQREEGPARPRSSMMNRLMSRGPRSSRGSESTG